MKGLFFILIFCSFLVSYAQFTSDVNFTGSHARVIRKTKMTRQMIKQRRQQMKEYRAYMEAKAEYLRSYDSLRQARIDSLCALCYEDGLIPDSIQARIQLKPSGAAKQAMGGLFNDQVSSVKSSVDSTAGELKEDVNVKKRVDSLKAKQADIDSARAKAYRKMDEKQERLNRGTTFFGLIKRKDKGPLQMPAMVVDDGTPEPPDVDSTAMKIEEVVDASETDSTDSVIFDPRYPCDTLLNVDISMADSLAMANQLMATGDFPVGFGDMMLNPPPFPELEAPTLAVPGTDSTAGAAYLATAQGIGQGMVQSRLGGFQGPQQGNLGALGESFQGQIPGPMTSNPNLLSFVEMQNQFSQVDTTEFSKEQAEVEAKKRAYSEMPDMRHPDQGKKRNSLKEKSILQRIYLAGHLNLASTDPLVLDFALQPGYWLNKKWLAGVGFVFREQFGARDSSSLVTGDSWGTSVFTRYDLPINGIYAMAEWERLQNQSLFGSEIEGVEPEWQSAYYLGAGTEFRVGFLTMMFTVMYDFNYRENDLNPRPIVTRLGFRFTNSQQ